MLIFIAMFGMGLLLGFVGAGGAGVVIAVLTVAFGIPIHTALGTSLGAMGFTTLSGVYSHFREDNVVIKCGLAVGIFGGLGAYLGVKIATFLPAYALTRLTACMLFLSAVLIGLRIFSNVFSRLGNITAPEGGTFWVAAAGVGLVAGVLSGAFGIGGAPFIQIGLLVFFRLSLPQVAGTTMLVTLPIALFGGLGYLTAGYLDMDLFVKVIIGLMTGTYIGAKFTRRLPPAVLKTAMVVIPVVGGLLLWFGS
jgi:uncharacterized membrane protein YfcA